MHYGSNLEEDTIATGITIHLKTQVLLIETERSSTHKLKLALQSSQILSMSLFSHQNCIKLCC